MWKKKTIVYQYNNATNNNLICGYHENKLTYAK